MSHLESIGNTREDGAGLCKEIVIMLALLVAMTKHLTV